MSRRNNTASEAKGAAPASESQSTEPQLFSQSQPLVPPEELEGQATQPLEVNTEVAGLTAAEWRELGDTASQGFLRDIAASPTQRWGTMFGADAAAAAANAAAAAAALATAAAAANAAPVVVVNSTSTPTVTPKVR